MSDDVLRLYYKRHIKDLAALGERMVVLQQLIDNEEREADRRGIDLNG